jgi:hypothetical protein
MLPAGPDQLALRDAFLGAINVPNDCHSRLPTYPLRSPIAFVAVRK